MKAEGRMGWREGGEEREQEREIERRGRRAVTPIT